MWVMAGSSVTAFQPVGRRHPGARRKHQVRQPGSRCISAAISARYWASVFWAHAAPVAGHAAAAAATRLSQDVLAVPGAIDGNVAR
jgi:hypothetical protein